MNFRKDFLKKPLPSAIEQTLECQILSSKTLEHPMLDLGCGDGIFAYVLFDEKNDIGIDHNVR